VGRALTGQPVQTSKTPPRSDDPISPPRRCAFRWPRFRINRQYQVFLRINGVLHYLWRAVDQHGVVLDILVQDRRNGSAAKRFFKRLLAGLKYKPRRLVTDGLKSYGVA